MTLKKTKFIESVLTAFTALPLFIYKKLRREKTFLKSVKMEPSVSLVFIVRNNQKLLEQSLNNIPSINKNITEVIVIDIGSIDNTIKVINNYNANNIEKKIYIVDSSIENNNCFDILRAHVSNEEVLIIDLNRIEKTNPSVYIPDIFRPIGARGIDKSKKYDDRIDGVKLLSFDFLEREKNSYILKEYIIEALNNIHMQIELLTNKNFDSPGAFTKKLNDVNEYIDITIKKTGHLINLIGTTKFYENNLKEGMAQLLKDYSQSAGVTINYKVSGNENNVIEPVQLLLLCIMQDLFSFILQGNKLKDMDVILACRKKELKLLVKYHSIENTKNIIYEKATLSHFVLQSIQNRLNLISGNMRIKIDKNNSVKLFIKIPMLNDSIKIRSDNNDTV